MLKDWDFITQEELFEEFEKDFKTYVLPDLKKTILKEIDDLFFDVDFTIWLNEIVGKTIQSFLNNNAIIELYNSAEHGPEILFKFDEEDDDEDLWKRISIIDATKRFIYWYSDDDIALLEEKEEKASLEDTDSFQMASALRKAADLIEKQLSKKEATHDKGK